MKKTIKAGEGTKKYNLFLHKKFKLHNGVWHSWHNNEYQPFWTTPKTHRAHIMHLKQIIAR